MPSRIYQLRKTKTNIQILQQNVLLKQKYMVTFLRQHGSEVFQEIRTAYVETLSRVLSSHFRSYLAALERLQVSLHPFAGVAPLKMPFREQILAAAERTTCTSGWVEAMMAHGNMLCTPGVPSHEIARWEAVEPILAICALIQRALVPLQEDLAGPADVIGEAAPGGVGGVMANLFQRGASGPHRDAFALGERGNILHHLDQAAIIPHVAESESRKAPFEARPCAPVPACMHHMHHAPLPEQCTLPDEGLFSQLLCCSDMRGAL